MISFVKYIKKWNRTPELKLIFNEQLVVAVCSKLLIPLMNTEPRIDGSWNK